MRVKVAKTKRGLRCYTCYQIVFTPVVSVRYWRNGHMGGENICMSCIGKQLLEVNRGQRMDSPAALPVIRVADGVLPVSA
jgi:hypothetical protein